MDPRRCNAWFADSAEQYLSVPSEDFSSYRKYDQDTASKHSAKFVQGIGEGDIDVDIWKVADQESLSGYEFTKLW